MLAPTLCFISDKEPENLRTSITLRKSPPKTTVSLRRIDLRQGARDTALSNRSRGIDAAPAHYVMAVDSSGKV